MTSYLKIQLTCFEPNSVTWTLNELLVNLYQYLVPQQAENIRSIDIKLHHVSYVDLTLSHL